MAITDETPMDVDVDTPCFGNVGRPLAKQGTIYFMRVEESIRPPMCDVNHEHVLPNMSLSSSLGVVASYIC